MSLQTVSWKKIQPFCAVIFTTLSDMLWSTDSVAFICQSSQTITHEIWSRKLSWFKQRTTMLFPNVNFLCLKCSSCIALFLLRMCLLSLVSPAYLILGCRQDCVYYWGWLKSMMNYRSMCKNQGSNEWENFKLVNCSLQDSKILAIVKGKSTALWHVNTRHIYLLVSITSSDIKLLL